MHVTLVDASRSVYLQEVEMFRVFEDQDHEWKPTSRSFGTFEYVDDLGEKRYNVILEHVRLMVCEYWAHTLDLQPMLKSSKSSEPSFCLVVEEVRKFSREEDHSVHNDIKPAHILITKLDDPSSFDCPFKHMHIGLTSHLEAIYAKGLRAAELGNTSVYCKSTLSCRTTTSSKIQPAAPDVSKITAKSRWRDIWSMVSVISVTAAWFCLEPDKFPTFRTARGDLN
jgi:serine/threonine protein kinase